jgi:hypothetical protein
MDNWVTRRASQEQNVASSAPVFWSAVSSALRDACDAYRKHYETGVELIPENGSRILIVKASAEGYTKETITVVFKADRHEIEVTRREDTLSFQVTADETSAFALERPDGPKLSPDDVSRKILEPVLFPPKSPSVQFYRKD